MINEGKPLAIKVDVTVLGPLPWIVVRIPSVFEPPLIVMLGTTVFGPVKSLVETSFIAILVLEIIVTISAVDPSFIVTLVVTGVELVIV